AWTGADGRPYDPRPILDAEPEIYRQQATGYEENLGRWLAGQPRVRDAAQAAVARLREILTAHDGGDDLDPALAGDDVGAFAAAVNTTFRRIVEGIEPGRARELG